METMATVLISGLITGLQQHRMPGLEEERQKLLGLLLAIQPVLLAAERLFLDEDTEHMAETWLRDVDAAAYGADDILDEFRYAKLQAEMETDRHQSGDNVRTSIFSFCKIGGMRLPFKGGMMRKRLRAILTRFEDLNKRSTYFISQGGPKRLLPGAEG